MAFSEFSRNFLDPNQNAFDLRDFTALMNFMVLPDTLEFAINFTLSHPNLQQLMSESFDLVIVEVFHSESLLGEFKVQIYSSSFT